MSGNFKESLQIRHLAALLLYYKWYSFLSRCRKKGGIFYDKGVDITSYLRTLRLYLLNNYRISSFDFSCLPAVF
jgi:hypothetical protein